jgi:hypothetical protein
MNFLYGVVAGHVVDVQLMSGRGMRPFQWRVVLQALQSSLRASRIIQIGVRGTPGSVRMTDIL